VHVVSHEMSFQLDHSYSLRNFWNNIHIVSCITVWYRTINKRVIIKLPISHVKNFIA